MKNSTLNILIFSFLILNGCTCKKYDDVYPNRENIIKLKATLSDTNFILKQNDTLFMSVSFPDSVKLTTLTRDTLINIKSLSDTYTMLIYGILDTTVSPVRSSINYDFVYINGDNRGKTGIYYFNTSQKKSSLKLGILLKEKGLYNLNVKSMLGEFYLNNTIKGSLAIDFDVADKHIEKFRRFTGNDWAFDAIDRGVTKGLGTYCFEVK